MCLVLTSIAILSAKSAMAQGTSACVQLPAGAVAWYPAEGNANDDIGSHNGVLQNGVSFGPGVVGQGFVFDGIDDYVSVVDDGTFSFGAGPFSVSVWAKTAGGRSVNEPVFSKGNLWSGVDDYSLFIAAGADGRVDFQYDSYNCNLLSTKQLNDDNWHHVVATQSGACSGCMKLYIDGSLNGTQNGWTLGNGVDPFVVGATFSGGLLYPYKGAIDELAVFHRVLTEDEIKSVYQQYMGGAGLCTVGTITGHVTDPFGGVTSVEVDLLDGNGTSTHTDTTGTYLISQVPAGSYQVRVQPPAGEEPVLNPQTVTVTSGAIAQVDFTLTANPPLANIIDEIYGAGAGSFERGSFVDNGHGWMSLGVGNMTITGWTVGGPGNGVDWLNKPTFAPSDGSKAVDLSLTTPSSVSTTIPTVPGQQYTITFDSAALTNNGGNAGAVTAGSLVSQPFVVTITSPAVDTQVWTSYFFQFTATGASTTLTFSSTSPSCTAGFANCYGPALDNVWVFPSTQVVPAVSALGSHHFAIAFGMLSALGIFIASRRRSIVRRSAILPAPNCIRKMSGPSRNVPRP